jgi:hypothetical protein
MKCKVCKKELVIANSQSFKKDDITHEQRDYVCINKKCEWLNDTQKVECVCKQK